MIDKVNLCILKPIEIVGKPWPRELEFIHSIVNQFSSLTYTAYEIVNSEINIQATTNDNKKLSLRIKYNEHYYRDNRPCKGFIINEIEWPVDSRQERFNLTSHLLTQLRAVRKIGDNGDIEIVEFSSVKTEEEEPIDKSTSSNWQLYYLRAIHAENYAFKPNQWYIYLIK